MSLYSIKNFEGHYVIAKFTDDLDLESTYEYHIIDGVHTCHCPAGQRPTCRHRQMFPLLHTRVDSPWFLDFDTRQWVDPTGEASEQEITDALTEIAIEDAKPTMTMIDEATPVDWDKALAPRDDHPFRRRM